VDAARQAEAAYETLSAALKYETPGRVTLILVSRDRDLDATVLRPLDLPPSGDAARRRVVISLESLDRRGGLIVHELTHQFAFEIVPGTSRVVPVLIEGLAEHQRGQWPPQDLRRTREGACTPRKSKTAAEIALRRGSPFVGTGIPFEGELLVSYTIIILVAAVSMLTATLTSEPVLIGK